MPRPPLSFRFSSRFVAIAVLFMLSLTSAIARAAGPADAAPLVRASTVAVAYVDLTRVDAQAAADWLVQAFEANQSVNAADRDALVNEIRSGSPELAKRLTAGKGAGLREAYLVFEMPGPANGGSTDPVVALRLADGATPDAALAALFGEAPHGDDVKLIEGLHVMGRPNQIDRLTASAPTKRAEFDRAAAVVGDAPLAIVVAPPAGSLNVFPLMLPKLPDEFGGTDTRDLCDGVESFVLFGKAPADPKLDLHIVCANPKVLADAIAKTRAGMAATLQSGKLPGGAMNAAQANMLTTILNALPPFAAGEGAVTMVLDDAALRKLADAGLVPLVEARRQAVRVRGAANARSILQGVIMHATENKGMLPASIDDLEKYFGDRTAEMKVVPGTENEEFVYLGVANTKITSLKPAATTVLLMQPIGDKAANDRIIVGFADGHVEMLSVEELRNRLKDGTIKTANGQNEL